MQTDPAWLYIPDPDETDLDAIYDWELETQSMAETIMDVETPGDYGLEANNGIT